jgi:hypothetical protein
MRFQVLIMTSMKMTVFWDDVPPLSGHPDDGDNKLLWNISQYLPDYTAQHPRRQSSSVMIRAEGPIRISVALHSIKKYMEERKNTWGLQKRPNPSLYKKKKRRLKRTEHCSRVVIIPPTYLAGPVFESLYTDRFCLVCLSPSRQMPV